jgi:hypothetical protein
MSTVPRGTSRLSVRVPAALKTDVQTALAALQGRGLGTSETELVNMIVAGGVARSVDELEDELRTWRRARAKVTR